MRPRFSKELQYYFPKYYIIFKCHIMHMLGVLNIFPLPSFPPTFYNIKLMLMDFGMILAKSMMSSCGTGRIFHIFIGVFIFP